MTHQLQNGVLRLQIPVNSYSEAVLLKCFYWYTGSYAIDITNEETHYCIEMKKIGAPLTNEETEALLNKLKQDLIDFKLRSIVSEETKTVRELIIAKAFAHFDTAEDPGTPIGDAMGFDPTSEP